METEHRIHVGDAREMAALGDDAVELVVTSPPYPMIEMWDGLFAELDPDVEDLLAAGDGEAAFEAMHAALDPVWDELARVLVDGGVAAINVGDATRSGGDGFQLYPNHAELITRFRDRGFDLLPDVLWRKPANGLTKFMGSGMVPPNAYATLEHEYVLLFRNGDSRSFEAGADRRYEAAYFWEERNDWFSDLWTDVQGEGQRLDHDDLRARSAAFPFEVPYRLVNMYSVYGDTVLDPFWGTGTTTLAAMVAGRNSAGYELSREFREVFDDRLADVERFADEKNRERLDAHREFATGQDLAYDAENYDFGVKTKQERQLQLYTVEGYERDGDRYVVSHEAFEG
ncbi:site-specific DNA-methyltransferase [Halorussus sp. MSC15.2]|uniref:DNA-methyltransferase n=1 Tax=Halorussus sp. MSC15.2 TaxID=2283638 RepID=UPI0013D1E872|nr:site-specific DNA-methyltransferase [Halorussus sp. MSC15.2]NEU57656.1 site-specific DNA-methyltransferase [Halorussus sp. MSC15.2]